MWHSPTALPTLGTLFNNCQAVSISERSAWDSKSQSLVIDLDLMNTHQFWSLIQEFTCTRSQVIGYIPLQTSPYWNSLSSWWANYSCLWCSRSLLHLRFLPDFPQRFYFLQSKSHGYCGIFTVVSIQLHSTSTFLFKSSPTTIAKSIYESQCYSFQNSSPLSHSLLKWLQKKKISVLSSRVTQYINHTPGRAPSPGVVGPHKWTSFGGGSIFVIVVLLLFLVGWLGFLFFLLGR